MTKRKNITILALCSLIFAAWVVYSDSRTRLDNTSIRGVHTVFTPTPTPEKNIFDLEVRGNMLYSSDGKPFVLRGVSTNFFRTPGANTSIQTAADLLTYLEQVRQWGANAFQLYLNPELLSKNSQEGSVTTGQVRQVVDWGQSHNAWIILNPVLDVTWQSFIAVRTPDKLLARDRIAGFLADLAQEFVSYPNVLFGLEAEPKFIDDAGMIYERIKAIRQYSDQPIFMPVSNFSGKLDIEALVKKEQIPNVIIDYHPYKGRSLENPEGADVSEFGDILVDEDIYAMYPVVFGEFGGFWEKDFNTPEDIAYMIQVGELAKRMHISFFAYAVDDWLMEMFDANGTVNKRGEAVRKLLESADN